MELRDKNGLTEREFLEAYAGKNYPKPSLTADILVFTRHDGKVSLLLIRRGGHPYLGCLALPGGFAQSDETIEQSAARELLEETGVSGVPLQLVGIFSKPGRDPRGWVVTAAYASLLDGYVPKATAGDDAADTLWYDVLLDEQPVKLRRDDEEILLPEGSGSLAFDHSEMILAAIRQLFNKP